MRFFSIAVLAAALSAGPAMAASPMGQLKDVDGTVYVNRGAGFVQVREPTELFQGDRVLVGENSSAGISYYLAECDVMLAATSVTTISANAPCKGAGGAELASQGLTMEREGVWIAGGVGIAATIGGIIALTSGGDDNDNGQSP